MVFLHLAEHLTGDLPDERHQIAIFEAQLHATASAGAGSQPRSRNAPMMPGNCTWSISLLPPNFGASGREPASYSLRTCHSSTGAPTRAAILCAASRVVNGCPISAPLSFDVAVPSHAKTHCIDLPNSDHQVLGSDLRTSK